MTILTGVIMTLSLFEFKYPSGAPLIPLGFRRVLVLPDVPFKRNKLPPFKIHAAFRGINYHKLSNV